MVNKIELKNDYLFFSYINYAYMKCD